MTSITQYYISLYPKPDLSSYLSLIEEQRITYPFYPKTEPGLHSIPIYSFSDIEDKINNEAFEYRGIKNYGDTIHTNLYLEFSKGEGKDITKHQYLYLPISKYNQVLSKLPYQVQYSISDKITRQFYSYNDSPIFSSEANYGGRIVESTVYADRPIINKVYPSFYTTLDSSVDINKFYKVASSFSNSADYTHPLLPGFIFSGRSGMYFDKEVYYEYFDWHGLHSPKWSLHYSILRPTFLSTPLGNPSSVSLVQDSCLDSQIGNYPSHSTPEFTGRFTGTITDCTYHPSYIYYLYEREDGSNFLYQSAPHSYAEDVYRMIPSYLEGENILSLSSSESTQSISILHSSIGTLTLSSI